MSSVQCFLMHETDRVRVSLRRFTFGVALACPKSTHGHESGFREIEHDDVAVRWIDRHVDGSISTHEIVAKIDERWPLVCVQCGEEFPDGAERQINAWPLYSGAPDGKLYTRRDAPAGAMYDAIELHQHTWACGPDGRALHVVLPDGTTWHVDGPPTGPDRKSGWTRSGNVPAITVRPSIQTALYHGILVDGILQAV